MAKSPSRVTITSENVAHHFRIRCKKKNIDEAHLAILEHFTSEYQLSYPIVEKTETVYTITQDTEKADFENQRPKRKGPKREGYPPREVRIFTDTKKRAVIKLLSSKTENEETKKENSIKEQSNDEKFDILFSINEKKQSITLKPNEKNLKISIF